MGALIIVGALMASQMSTFRELPGAETASHLHHRQDLAEPR
jgi:hypothetical protein